MLFYTVGQPQAFLGMMYAGLAVGFLFDVAALVRKLLAAGKILTLAVDCAFSLLSVMLLAAVWLHVNYLDFRVYALMGAACGALLYALTVRPLLKLIVVRPLILLARTLKRIAGAKILRKIFR
jgi:spore cortex biosynthesis protein YabQ